MTSPSIEEYQVELLRLQTSIAVMAQQLVDSQKRLEEAEALRCAESAGKQAAWDARVAKADGTQERIAAALERIAACAQ